MKQLFVVRWFHSWRKQRVIDRAWDMRTLPPCKWCQRPIPERSDFCMYCGMAQWVPPQMISERNTSGNLPVKRASVVEQPTATMPVMPVARKYDITNELARYHRHGDGINHWQMKAFRRMIFDEGEEKK